MKRILSLVLVLALALSVSAFAVDNTQAQTSAQLLYNLGLFRGAGTNKDGTPNFSLDRAATRGEAVVMLVRLLGAEEKATSKSWSTPFTDLPNWLAPYVGYAYTNGLVNGLTKTTFSPNTNVTSAQYLTFLLRALGYQDSTDFSYKNPWELTDELNITGGEYSAKSTFLRGDAAYVSANALSALRKGSDQTLLDYLLENGSITDSNMVIWNYAPLSLKQDFASFLFYPVEGSPATFTSFKIDKATVNGLAIRTMQITTPEDVSKYMASTGATKGGFGYIELTYDQDAVEAAADGVYTAANGKTYPLLRFTFRYTALRSDGKSISDTFSATYYMENR